MSHSRTKIAHGVRSLLATLFVVAAVLATAPEAGALTPAASDQGMLGSVALEQARLYGPGIDMDHYFGHAVAISGDTAVVAEWPEPETGFSGRVHVFVRGADNGWTQQATLTATGGTPDDGFGDSVAIAGDIVVVGAPYYTAGANNDQGAAYVFVRSGTTWSQQQRLTASDGSASELFGTAVALSGDTAVVGTPNDAIGASTNQGSAYVFVRSGTTWTQQRKLTDSGGAAGDYFGTSVAVSSDSIAVGVPYDDLGATQDAGSACVFVRSGTTWAQQQKLTAVDAAAGDRLGGAVAIDADTVATGAHGAQPGGQIGRGAVYIFTRTGTAWSQQAKIVAADGGPLDEFGQSVALSNDTVAVGSRALNSSTGLTYVFVRNGASWSQQACLVPFGATLGSRAGSAVAVCGDTLVSGAPYASVASVPAAGSAAIFTRADGSWAQRASLVAGGYPQVRFGESVAVSGDLAVVGSPYDDTRGDPQRGSACVFVRSGTAWALEAKLTAPDGAAGDTFGWSVAISGETVVVGSQYNKVDANPSQGAAYVFVRNGTTWSLQQKLSASDGVAGDCLGLSVAISGDTVVAGADRRDAGADVDAGAAYVFTRSGTTWSEQATLTADDGAAYDGFGAPVAISKDTIAIGARNDDVGANTDQGSAYVFERSGTTWSQQAKLTADDGAAHDDFGAAVATDGQTVAVTADAHDVGANADQGAAYVFTRAGTTWTQEARLTVSDGAANEWFGLGVAVSGNAILVGDPLRKVGDDVNQGAAYLFWRSGTTWSQHAQLTAADGMANNTLGESVAISGDTALAGAPGDRVSLDEPQGSVSVFTGVAAPPGKPVARSPKGVIASRTPTFRWRSASGALTYEVRVYKGTRLLRTKRGLTTLWWKCTRRLPQDVRLTWKVRAVNEGGPGPWSGPLSFQVR